MILISVFALAINIFIIVQASLNGASSTDNSNGVASVVENIVNGISPGTVNESNYGIFLYVIRKLVGHFGLFVFDGLFTSWAIYLWLAPLKFYKLYRFTYISLGYGFFLGGLTEIIQLFVPGRGGAFTDVLIDFSGFILGFLLIFIIVFIIEHKKLVANKNECH